MLVFWRVLRLFPKLKNLPKTGDFPIRRVWFTPKPHAL